MRPDNQIDPNRKIDPTKIYLALGLFIASALFGICEIVRGVAQTPAQLLLFGGIGLAGIGGAAVIVVMGFKMKRRGK